VSDAVDFWEVSQNSRRPHPLPSHQIDTTQIREHTAPPSFTIPPPPFILDAAKLLHLAL